MHIPTQSIQNTFNAAINTKHTKYKIAFISARELDIEVNTNLL